MISPHRLALPIPRSTMSLGERFPQVLEAARVGEDWAIAALYRDLHPRVVAYLRHRCRDEAEDVAQETWMDVAQALGRFTGTENEFRRLVFVIAKRRSIDHARRSSARPSEPTSDEVLALHPQGDAEADALERLTSQEAVSMILELLSQEQAEIVLLRVLGGFSAEEVAVMLDRRPGTIRALQHRALRRLAARFPADTATEQLRKAI
jgi:RNA polymerase sigma-70 factor (ECF subfamily)